ncbi:MAG: GDP-mannose 4,6-dehydratase [Candidatus Geothermincolia bacterium]
MKRALITGITGQDGSYLAEYLLAKGYEVHGIKRRSSSFNTHRIDHLYLDEHEHKGRLHMHFGELADAGRLTNLIWQLRPDEVYHLAAQSHVAVSFDEPEYTGNVTGLGTTRLLEAIRLSGVKSRFYQASSSEMFGAAPPPQNELTAFHPRSPYAAAKVYAYWITVNYRESYGLFGCNGILFNHESPRRGETFVTRKITRALAAILAGRQRTLHLGNLDAKRDWGFAPDYIVCQWQILQQDAPEDFVIGTGQTRSVRDFVVEAFAYAGVELEWRGTGLEEKGVVRSLDPARVPASAGLKPGDPIIHIDRRYFRPAEVDYLLADPAKAKRVLGWEPKLAFRELVRCMADADLEAAGIEPPGEGLAILAKHGYEWILNTKAISGDK